MSYQVVRLYQNKPGYRRTIIQRCTLEEAQEHCGNPETSSSTATSAEALRRTQRHGPWFDAYEEN
jgi:hypothetical protein